MRRVALLLICGAAAALACVACGSFSSADAPVGPDASTDALAPVTEAGAASDAHDHPPPDAAPTISVPFCADAGVHDLCDDFDEGPLSPSWATGRQASFVTGVGGIRDAESTSPPSSLFFHLTTQPTPTPEVQGVYFLHRTFTKPATEHVTLSFAIFVDTLLDADAATTAPDVVVAGLGTSSYRIELNLTRNMGAFVVDVAETWAFGSIGHAFDFGAQTFQLHAWHRVVMGLDYTTKDVSVTIDDAVGMHDTNPFHVTNGSTGSQLALDLGVESDQIAEDSKVYVDDVVFDIDR